jgi:hypothetical protein
MLKYYYKFFFSDLMHIVKSTLKKWI